MNNILTFLFHQLAGSLVKRVWRQDELLTASTLLRGRYRISKVHELGRENPVYLAYDEIQDRDVAVKENALHDPAWQAQFELEAGILASLDHPNIPKAFDSFIENGRQFFVMDYIEGTNLQQVLERTRPSTEQILEWASNLCDILIYLHSLVPPVLHLDIEPSNIILAADGRIFLVDFGFAKIYRPELETFATPKRASPRSGSGDRTLEFDPQNAHQFIPWIIDRRSDQYALAATLYALLTGEPPRDGRERLAGKPKLAPIRSSRPDLSASAEEAIFRALSLDQNRRFSIIEDFKSALGC